MNKEEKNTILIIEKTVQRKEVFRQNIFSLYYTQGLSTWQRLLSLSLKF